MSASKRYVLDANAFIEAKNRYYGLDICPGFWDALIAQHDAKQIFSIDRIRAELAEQDDEIKDWVKNQAPDSFFKKTEDQAVIAYAAVNKLVVVTHEEFAPAAKRKVPMPNVCVEFDVEYVNTFEMLRSLNERFIRGRKSR